MGPASVELRNGRLRALVTRENRISVVYDFLPIAAVPGQSFAFEVFQGAGLSGRARGRFQLAQVLPDGRIEVRAYFIEAQADAPTGSFMTLTCEPPRSQR
jgi:hypothetical protein